MIQPLVCHEKKLPRPKGFNCTGDSRAASSRPQHLFYAQPAFPLVLFLSLLPVTLCPVLLPASFWRRRTIKPLTSTQTDGQTGERMLHSLCTETARSSLGEAYLFRAKGNKKKTQTPNPQMSFPTTQPPALEKYFALLFICRGLAELNP